MLKNFKLSENETFFFKLKKKKKKNGNFKEQTNAILLVLPFQEISLRPEFPVHPVSESRGLGLLSVTDKVRNKKNSCV